MCRNWRQRRLRNKFNLFFREIQAHTAISTFLVINTSGTCDTFSSHAYLNEWSLIHLLLVKWFIKFKRDIDIYYTLNFPLIYHLHKWQLYKHIITYNLSRWKKQIVKSQWIKKLKRLWSLEYYYLQLKKKKDTV